ncbi:MAG: Grx4 family monothiol glutaredoxin [Hyphomicrobiaceae bacterium]|nr:Grx4 family monothiol glutaredoxin [Hyphomicrobiaceae bacterium]
MNVQNSINERIQHIVDSNDVVLFMKGIAKIPQCGFSAKVAQILNVIGANYKDINVLEDSDIREGIKTFSNWPTIPQLYVKGEFVGGCDIVREMYEQGELQDLFEQKGLSIKSNKTKI